MAKIEDKLDKPPKPLEENDFAEIINKLKQSITEAEFELGLKTNYEQMLSFIHARKRHKPDYIFTDPNFTPTRGTLVRSHPTRGICWARPHEMSVNPLIFKYGESRQGILQGKIGNSYWLSSCADVAMHSRLMTKLIPNDQTLDKNDSSYNGLIRIRFWRFGKWREVIIDDLLPTMDGLCPFYGKSCDPNEFWVPLMEKAYAKLLGSYDAMVGGYTSDILVDLTGGLVEEYLISEFNNKEKKELFKKLRKTVRHNSFVCCGIERTFNSTLRQIMGLVFGHAYSVTDAAQIHLKNGTSVNMVKVRNPWGNSVEWEHQWSNKSEALKEVRSSHKSRLNIDESDDVEWWMTHADFLHHFHKVTICSVGVEYNEKRKYKNNRRWLITTVRGSWKSGINAGGSGNDITKYATNPQYLLRLIEADDDDSDLSGFTSKQCTVKIGLMQECRRWSPLKRLGLCEIGLRVYKLKNRIPRKLEIKFLESSKNVMSQTKVYKEQREVSLHLDLYPGYYVIIPSMFYSDYERSYLIRIFTEKKIKLTELR